MTDMKDSKEVSQVAKEVESEAQLEDRFMQQLAKQGYQTIQIDKEADLINHFRLILNQRNRINLKDEELTDTEFNRVMNELVGSKTLFEIAQLLRGSDIQPAGKISIQRDDGSNVYLEFFDGQVVENNIFEVTHQVTVNARYTNRYDVTILVNGLPLVQVELKRRGGDFEEAFHQIIRYRNDSFRNLYRFVQIFVVSDGVDTRYFANGDGNLNANFMFYWTDEENNWLNDITDFTASFLSKSRLHSMISKYTVFDHSNDSIMIMRPYQVYAVEAIVNQAQNHPNKNGYVWHTTGSGKTITAFKASQILTRETDAEKVIFLIDRSDLDIQTAKNFNAYSAQSTTNEPAIDQTNSTASLVRQLQASDTPLIISTIQKMNTAVKEDSRYRKLLTEFHDKRVIFIEDEAHRSQFGDMRKNINQWFANSQHFGFTGTPIFAENVGPDGRTTESLYDEELHHYLIKDAIRDHNVLGFSVQYINTLKGKDDLSTEEINEKVAKINTAEVFEADERIQLVTKHILMNHRQLTKNGHYNAIFTVPSTEIALKYYQAFKQLDPNHELKVTTIFTWVANEENAVEKQDQAIKSSRLGLDQVIADYNEQYGTEFSTDTFSEYFADVSKRMKEHNDQAPDSNIDVLIVVNMFLTGFDSKRLATLYVDKSLQYQGLIQAFSRTNRVETDSKPSGNIVSYRNLKAATDQAVTLYSAGSKEDFYVKSYDELAAELRPAIATLVTITPDAKAVDELFNQGDSAIKTFVLAFREVLRIHNKIRVYEDFKWDNFAADGLNAQLMADFQSKYVDAYRYLQRNREQPEAASILEDINFEIELLETDRIDVDYIINLVKAIDLDSQANRQSDSKRIKQMLNDTNDLKLRSKADLIAAFLDSVVPNLPDNANVGDELNQFLAQRRKLEVNDFAEENKVPAQLINSEIDDYDFYGHTNPRRVTEELNKAGYGFKEKVSLSKKIKSFVLQTVERFTMS